MKMKIEGLDALQKELKDAQKALEALHGEIARLSCNPYDPKDIEQAIRQMEQKVDAKVSRYRNNPLVRETVKAMKESYREQILQAVEEKKKGGEP